MKENSLFVVIEGLDGSGKTSAGRQLAYFLQEALGQEVKLTFEPHDPSCGGLFIRQILEKKITDFTPETLMLAFAANRRDHGDRQINPWLAVDDSILICDRYYLSSLVYQSDENFSMDYVMRVNQNARKPDITFFMNVSNEVCFERMKIRNKPLELFEKDLSETREKYLAAIDFLRKERDEKIVVIDASGTLKEVVTQLVEYLSDFGLENRKEKLSVITNYALKEPAIFSEKEKGLLTIEKIAKDLKIIDSGSSNSKLVESKTLNNVSSFIKSLDFTELSIVFFNYLESLGYHKKDQSLLTNLVAHELEYSLPGGIAQRGVALLINEEQKYDDILQSASTLFKMSDFLLVFMPGSAKTTTQYIEREIIKYTNQGDKLFPAAKIITVEDLEMEILKKVLTG